MLEFGLVCEGYTDQIVIDNILYGFFRDPDMLVSPLVPLRDETDSRRVEEYGGWFQVLEYCASQKFRDAFDYLRYLVVQIDTDVSEEIRFGVSHRDSDGSLLSPDQLVFNVIAKFRAVIGEEFFDAHQERIIFAIAVDSIECWLLPLYYSDDRKSKTTNCIGSLNQKLNKEEGFSIDPDSKDPKYYKIISKKYTKKKLLLEKYQDNSSLCLFIQQLQEKCVSFDSKEG